MLLRKFSLAVLIIMLTLPAISQQKVDLDKALAENPNLFTGGFTRVGVGFSRTSFSYGPEFEGLSLTPLRFHLDFGKRMSRMYGIYFSMTGDLLLKEIQYGYTLIRNWTQVGMLLGGQFYIKGGRSYIAPEVGLGIITFEYEDLYSGFYEQPYCVGLGTSLKYGYDRHISGKVSLGAQLFVNYSHTWETGAPEGFEAFIAKSFLYGVSINLKFGK